MAKNKKDFEYILKKDKNEIYAIFGEQFNDPRSLEWTFEVKRTFFFKTILHIFFNHDGLVKGYTLKKHFSLY